MSMNRNYGDYDGARHQTPPRRRGLNLLDYVLLIATVVCAVLLLLAYLARYINPNDAWVFAFLGLAAPVFYIVNVALLLYWVLRWRVYALIPMVVLLVGIGGISSFFRPVLSKHYETFANDESTLTVVSYNVMGFLNREDPRHLSDMQETVAFIDSLAPDLLFMQEYQSTPKAPARMIDSLLEALPYRVINYKLSSSPEYGWGLAIYSRYPVVRSGHVDFEHSTNSSIWADVVVRKGDTLRLFNNHLQTTSINSSDRDFITTPEFIQSDNEVKKERVRNIIYKLRENYKIRARQADSLAPMIAESPYPVIVCGDFNDTPMSYTYHTIRGDLMDAFNEKGHGLTNTYRGCFNLFRIDYVLHSPVLETVSYSTPYSDRSDHNPVMVRLRWPEEQ